METAEIQKNNNVKYLRNLHVEMNIYLTLLTNN